MKVPPTGLFAVLSLIAAIAAVVAGLVVIGSPSEIRMRRFDERRANDFDVIANTIQTYRLTHEGLPEKLDGLARVSLKDPLGRPYEYRVKDAFSYELCAEFDTAQDKTGEAASSRSKFDKHGSGRQCFSLEARPHAQR
jgi:hypothetical protein